MDLKTLEGRAEARKEVQKFMLVQVIRALNAYQNLNDHRMRQTKITIERWQKIIARIKARAEELGYSKACRDFIPTCKGQCCKWHFPKKIYDVHFFISLNGLPTGETQKLIDLLSDTTKSAYQCPMLMENGCFLSFENRPVLCSSAYPCFSGKVYQDYLQKEKKVLERLYEDFEKIIISSLSAGHQ